MLTPMKSRVVAVGLSAVSLLLISACGSSGGGTGAVPATTIKIGTPSYQTLPPVVTSTTTAATTVGGSTGGAVVAGEQMYTIVGGDIMVRIAKNFCISAQQIVDYNQWADGFAHKLFPGDVIKIPPNACAPGTATTAAATVATTVATTPEATTTTFDAASGGTYTVVDGDTLSGIAAKTGTTVAGIVSANGWADETHVIYAGLKIKLPAKT